MFSPIFFQIPWNTLVEPVKCTPPKRRSATTGSPTAAPEPGTKLMTPGGRPASTSICITNQFDSTEVDATRPDTWAEAVTPCTRLFYVEAVSNPLLEVPQLDEVVRFCQERSLVSVIDNTLMSPAGFRPIPFGFDLVVHSATKYLNGHSDLVAGVVAGSAARIAEVARVGKVLGGSLDSHAAYLLDRGLKTLHGLPEFQRLVKSR